MILRLLKRLRTTVRTTLQIQSDRNSCHADLLIDRLWQPGLSGAFTKVFSTAAFSIAVALPVLTNAQEFRNPVLPNSADAGQTQFLQQKLQHDEALKQQMIRVQQEHGAESGFAEKAFQAQQTYLAQMARDEYQAYQALQQKQATPPPVAKRLPAPNQKQNSQSDQVRQDFYVTPTSHVQPGYVPPVHVRPRGSGVSMSFGDSGGQNANQSNRRGVGQSPVYNQRGQAPVQQTTYQQSSFQRIQMSQRRTNQELAPSAGQPPVHRAQNQVYARPIPKQPVPRVAAATNLQPTKPKAAPSPQRPRASVHLKTEQDFPYVPPQKVYGPNDPYVLGESPVVGLQDRISSLLSKPRYRDLAGSTQPVRTNVRAMGERIRRNIQPRNSQPPQQLAQHRHTMPQMRQPQKIAPRNLGLNPNQVRKAQGQSSRTSSNTASEIHIDPDVHLANEMATRIGNSMRTSVDGVRQVAMVEPKQDPFNDMSVGFASPALDGPMPPDAVQLESPYVSPSSFQDRNPRSLRGRQISVLRNQEPEQDDGQVPSLLEDAIGQKSDAELDRYDQELSKRLKELDEKAKQDAADKAKLDDLTNRINQDSPGSSEDDLLSNGGLDSVMEDDEPDDLSDFADKPPEKSCEEFRTELLSSSIRDISLDISPRASSIRDQYIAISRSWTDRMGNVIATGSMVDLRRGYVIIDGVGGRQKIPYGKLSDADWLAISEYWKIPALCSVGNGMPVGRNWVPQTFSWKASSLCHKPLFFENIQLERYGHSRGPFAQPVHSVAHFFVSLIKVPYQSKLTPANECQYALGFYRPGNCAPWLKDPIPFSLDGAKRQALWITSGAFIP